MEHRKLLNWLLLPIIVLTFFPLLWTGFTTTDDMITSIHAQKSLSEIFKFAIDRVYEHGRFYYALSILMAIAPYLFFNTLYIKLLGLGPMIINIFLMALIIKKYIGTRAAALFSVVFSAAVIQNSWEWNALNSDFFVHSVLNGALVLSFYYYDQYLDSGSVKKYWASIVLFAWATLGYEYYPLYVFIFYLISYGRTGNVKISFRQGYGHTAVFAAYMAIYIAYRKMYPTDYSGTQLDVNSFWDYLYSVYQYSISAFPGFYFIGYQKLIGEYTDSSYGHAYNIYRLFEHARVEWIVKAMLVGMLSWVYLIDEKSELSKNKIKGLIVATLFLIILPPAVLSLAGKYRDLAARGALGYSITYSSFFGVILLMTTLIYALKIRFQKNDQTLGRFAVGMAIIISLFSYITDYSNHAVTKSQLQSALKWRMIDLLVETDDFKAIPPGSIIVSPTLFVGLFRAQVYKSYWSDYIEIKSGKKLHVVSSMEDVIQGVGLERASQMSIYYVKRSNEVKQQNQFLTLSRINKVSSIKGGLDISIDSAVLFTHTASKSYLIFGRADAAKYVCVNGRAIAPDSAGAFFAHIDKTWEVGDLTRVPIHVPGGARINPDSITLSFFPNAQLSAILDDQTLCLK